MSTMSFGIIGLGVMGKSIAQNILNNGFSLSAYNRETETEIDVAKNFAKQNQGKKIQGYNDLQSFVNSLETPRKILIMVNAGKAVDQVMKQLLPLLSENDIIIDGGNSHYKDTNRRIQFLKEHSINLLGLGISGGEEGALKGPSLMPGGNLKSYELVAQILKSIAAKDVSGNPCCAYVGNEGAGHFVKMVHNGIEYADMQLLAELYAILSNQMTYDEISDLFFEWNKGKLSSYLLEITADILRTKDDNQYILDTILDKAGNKGTGSWSSSTALELGTPTTIKTAAVFARYISSFKEKRTKLAQIIASKNTNISAVDTKALQEAYDFARTLNLHQGLELLNTASEKFQWNIDLSEICRIWSNGCIIKSKKLRNSIAVLKKHKSLLEYNNVLEKLKYQEALVAQIIHYAVDNRLNIPCIMEAYSYWTMMTTEKSSANMIQAQRDYFGAHTYQKIDDSTQQWYHHNWKHYD